MEGHPDDESTVDPVSTSAAGRSLMVGDAWRTPDATDTKDTKGFIKGVVRSTIQSYRF